MTAATAISEPGGEHPPRVAAGEVSETVEKAGHGISRRLRSRRGRTRGGPVNEHVVARPPSRRPGGWLRVIPGAHRHVIPEDDVTSAAGGLPSAVGLLISVGGYVPHAVTVVVARPGRRRALSRTSPGRRSSISGVRYDRGPEAVIAVVLVRRRRAGRAPPPARCLLRPSRRSACLALGRHCRHRTWFLHSSLRLPPRDADVRPGRLREPEAVRVLAGRAWLVIWARRRVVPSGVTRAQSGRQCCSVGAFMTIAWVGGATGAPARSPRRSRRRSGPLHLEQEQAEAAAPGGPATSGSGSPASCTTSSPTRCR